MISNKMIGVYALSGGVMLLFCLNEPIRSFWYFGVLLTFWLGVFGLWQIFKSSELRDTKEGAE